MFGTTPGGTIYPEVNAALMPAAAQAGQMGFVGPALVPMRPVEATPEIQIVDPVEALKHTAEPREPGSAYKKVTGSFRSVQFLLRDYGLEQDIDKLDEARYGRFISQATFAARSVNQAALRALEMKLAAMLEDTTTYASQTSNVTNEWDDHANATPISDVIERVNKIERNSGMPAAEMVTVRMNANQWRNLLQCDQFLEAIHNAGAGRDGNLSSITPQMAAEALGVGRVLVSGSFKQSSGSTYVADPVWSDEYVQVGLFPATVEENTPAAIVGAYHTSEGLPFLQNVRIVERRDEPFYSVRASNIWDVQYGVGSLFEIIGNITTA